MSTKAFWSHNTSLSLIDGRLHLDGIDAVTLAREYGTPLFVFSEARIRHNIARLRQIGDVLPTPLKICYAAKAMSTMGVLRAIRDAGIDIEVNSGGELWKALQAGFSGRQIIFNGTSKEAWELELAIRNNIYAIQADSLYELTLIEGTAQHLDMKANVSLRLVPEIESKTHSGLQTALLTSKFGMMPNEALEAFAKYRSSSNLNLCGIHLHVGSQNSDPTVYTEALKVLCNMLVRIRTELGIDLEHINLGGGFPVDHLGEASPVMQPEQRGLLAADYEPYAAIASAWHEAAESHAVNDLTVLIEPGRSIIADAGICLTTVRNRKTRPVSADAASADDEHWLLTDAGFNILLSMETYKWYYHLISAERAGERHDSPYKLAGPLCDGGDVYFDIEGGMRLPDHRLLPENVRPDEILALLNCGAYSLAQASQYNGRFLPAVVLIDIAGLPRLIRKRDTFNDLVNNDI